MKRWFQLLFVRLVFHNEIRDALLELSLFPWSVMMRLFWYHCRLILLLLSSLIRVRSFNAKKITVRKAFYDWVSLAIDSWSSCQSLMTNLILIVARTGQLALDFLGYSLRKLSDSLHWSDCTCHVFGQERLVFVATMMMTLTNWEWLHLWIMHSSWRIAWRILIKCMLSGILATICMSIRHIKVNFNSLYPIRRFKLPWYRGSPSVMHSATLSGFSFLASLMRVSLALCFFDLIKSDTSRYFPIDIPVYRIKYFASCMLLRCLMQYLVQYIIDAFQNLVDGFDCGHVVWPCYAVLIILGRRSGESRSETFSKVELLTELLKFLEILDLCQLFHKLWVDVIADTVFELSKGADHSACIKKLARDLIPVGFVDKVTLRSVHRNLIFIKGCHQCDKVSKLKVLVPPT